jgi:hypothetical protein
MRTPLAPVRSMALKREFSRNSVSFRIIGEAERAVVNRAKFGQSFCSDSDIPLIAQGYLPPRNVSILKAFYRKKSKKDAEFDMKQYIHMLGTFLTKTHD